MYGHLCFYIIRFFFRHLVFIFLQSCFLIVCASMVYRRPREMASVAFAVHIAVSIKKKDNAEFSWQEWWFIFKSTYYNGSWNESKSCVSIRVCIYMCTGVWFTCASLCVFTQAKTGSSCCFSVSPPLWARQTLDGLPQKYVQTLMVPSDSGDPLTCSCCYIWNVLTTFW